MVRLFAVDIVLFALPFLVYAGWLYARQGSVPAVNRWPVRAVLTVLIVGTLLAIGGVAALTHFSGDRTGATYHPAEMRDGKLVPGGFK